MEDIWNTTGKEHKGASASSQSGAAFDPYAILGLGPEASQLAIRDAYLRLKQTFGVRSDAFYSLMTQDEAADTNEKVEKAFEILGDRSKRATYHLQVGLPVPASEEVFPMSDDANLQWQSERLTSMRSHGEDDAAVVDEGPIDVPQATSGIRKVYRPIPKIAPKSQLPEVIEAMNAAIDEGDLSDGFLYRELRELVGVSEDEVLERTKISLEYIHAIENNRLERLPPLVYLRGFLKSYLSYLNPPRQTEMVEGFVSRFQEWEKGQKRS